MYMQTDNAVGREMEALHIVVRDPQQAGVRDVRYPQYTIVRDVRYLQHVQMGVSLPGTPSMIT